MARRIVTFEWVTADGYFAASDGGLDWVVPDDVQARMAAQGMAEFDTLLFGRRTYQLFEGFWRNAVVDEAGTVADPHHPGRRSTEHGVIATALHRMTKLVFSRSLPEATWANSRLLREFDADEIAAMKMEPGKDMIVFGSGSIVRQLSQHGLIDEYQFAVCPVLLGSGRLLLRAARARVRPRFLQARGLPSGDVMVRSAC